MRPLRDMLGSSGCHTREGALDLLWPPSLLSQPPRLPPAPAQAQIVHAGQACVVKEDNISERVYTIREGDTLVLQCLVTGHPRPQVSPRPGLWVSPCPRLLTPRPTPGSEEAVGPATGGRW